MVRWSEIHPFTRCLLRNARCRRIVLAGEFLFVIFSLTYPGYVFSSSADVKEALTPNNVGPAYLASICFVAVWALTLQAAFVSARQLYSPGRRPKVTYRTLFGPVRVRLSKSLVLFVSIASYLMTIYAFALIYQMIQVANLPASPLPSNETQTYAFTLKFNGLFDAICFSTVTMATVGYGDYTPRTFGARFFVTTEILIGVGFSVFFFSIIAGFIREPDR